MAASGKAAMGFIFITMVIDVTGMGLIYPVLPSLLEEVSHGGLSDAARINGWLTLAYAVPQFVFAPLIGNLSDRFGRRPVLLASMLGFAIDYVFLSWAPTLLWLFVGRIIAGLTGASFSTATAYIADISTTETRAKNFGMIGAAFGLGFIIGPALGGLLGEFGTRVPFMAAAVLTALNWLFGYFVLPESLPLERRRSFDWKRANPVGAFMLLKRYPAIWGLASALVLVYIAGYSVQSTWNFFTIEKFNWTKGMIGVSLAIVGLLVGAVQGGLVRVINPKIGNEKSIYLGLFLYSIGLFLFSFASAGWMMFVFLIPYCLGGIAGPSLQAIISGHVSPKEQGELQGTMTSLMSVTMIIGPLLMSYVFSHFTRKDGSAMYFPGAAFFLGAILMLISAALAYRVLKVEKKQHPEMIGVIEGKPESDQTQAH
ncbi:TCR/Tet family MFS transporter [Terrimonas sp. NA20]|uniref:TCR/Tet family MFS transporter n=1 Tax=Terrimonas ginsenosidimutans TaxID=2908004 RepID=A0ABS9KL38_9BACT|nr:TCR/Tet family MFS transporter [Terrimonas ginsenosidimutans]MCG2613042.1 TCR/Tet family MFS transporter [Terrimonas ginsenosidimutans]